MIEIITTFTAFATAIAGMIGLCLAKERHYRLALPLSKLAEPPRRRLFWGGWVLLLVSVLLSMSAWGVGTGFSGWFGILTVAALFPVVLLSYAPRWLPGLGWAALMSAASAWPLIFWAGLA
ncbi:hypothetical protein CAI21_09380 [Alkalilimnicola ehrlichii]|uniref:DUF3325 domain-containing protein n=1 Tax=Alkalilimnicola ehrlichii TaxID=351052 RepID=UPI000E2F4FBC|nr:DUF3325 domain-containing protein [Alkalilimnicola ehrlichii]RFA29287.1 hypothetical protein CAI21_09380 [Alkalilimnicola ehrlichii]